MSVMARIVKVAAGFVAGWQVLELLGEGGFLLRPPGAASEADLLARCVRCGKCALACPYHVVKAAPSVMGEHAGTPCIEAREGACRLCEDFPCVAACPTGALRDIAERSDVRMGVAVIDRELCIALRGMRCEVCYRVCPLKDEAVTIKYSLREGDDRHAVFEPVIHSDACVGCGLCVERCVISDPAVAIRIEPAGASPHA
ncbi:MAG: 4Fe-4S dicluster domain-containing protein [Coriobacteriales bacterium]|jgi:ferredoxin-type protein NapG|nr:4Fe-4S dicluster domain-containing protein [Coriobacteriales bacterium]